MPELYSWPCLPHKKYSLMIMDNEGMAEGEEYVNYMVTNIPGCHVAMGYVAFSYQR